MLRTPLLPFETILEWQQAEDREAFLFALAARPEIRDALRIASRDFDAALERPNRRVVLALARYVARMASRPTPFGLFAGTSVGTIAAGTLLELPPLAAYERAANVGLHALDTFARELPEDVRERATLVPNSTLYELGGQFRYIAGKQLRGVRAAAEPRRAVELARGGITREALTEALTRELGLARERVAAFVAQLVANGILVADVRPRVTSFDPLAELSARLRGADAASAANLEAFARGSHEQHVTLRKPSPSLALGTAVANELARAAEVLQKIFGAAALDPVRRFREEFVKRYDTRFVPLLEALDDELGVGFTGFGEDSIDDVPLLAGLHFPTDARTPRWLPCHALLLEKVGQGALSGTTELVLTGEDVERMAARDALPLPDAFAAIGAVVRGSGPPCVLVHAVVGPSGAIALGRFCQTDAELDGWVRRHLRDEERLRPEAIFAEVVHLPEDRAGNVVARPPLRDHEIPFLGDSGLPRERQVDAADLLLGVAGQRLVLWSRTLDREIVPRVTSAHDYKTHGVSAYRFLAAMQRDGVSGALYWDWGPLMSLPFRPRVRVGNAILSRASWTVSTDALREGPLPGMPRFVVLVDGDHELLVDWQNPMTIEALLAAATRAKQVRLDEVLPSPEALAVQGPEGHFTHEVVVPFTRSESTTRAVARPVVHPAAVRSFAPGSEWSYFRLYTGYATADRLLTEMIAPLARGLRWFFVRYNDDGGFHLRVRFHCLEPERMLELARVFAANPLISRVELGTYERELERYGGPAAMALAEELFCADSDAVVKLLPYAAALRWQLAVYGSDVLLTDLGLDADEQRALLAKLVAGYGHEFRVDRILRDELARNTRDRAGTLRACYETAPTQPWHAAYRERSERVAPLGRELRRCATGEPYLDLAASVLHMHLNRWLRSAPRKQELVIYDQLQRLHVSREARGRVGER